MFRPSLKSALSLFLLFLAGIVLFLIAQFSYVTIKADFYDQKMEAANLMTACIDTLRAEQERAGIPFDPINDPYRTGLIGAARSTITTDRGLLSEKQAAVNPNLAAVFVEEFSKAGLESGDHIAVGITGSNPSLNLALYSAIKVLKLKPAVIVSLSSAAYGANLEEYTWLDIEAVLKRNNMVDFGCSYASLGGKDDLGIGLPDDGVTALLASMQRNGVPLLAGSTLEENVKARDAAYSSLLPDGASYKLFVNIGSGLANLGSEPNANLVPEGLSHKIAEKEYYPEGVMMLMARKNVPVFSMQRGSRWIKKYQLETAAAQMPKPGVGPAFSVKRHNVLVARICLALLLAAIIAVIIYDRHDRHFMANIVDPDEEL